MTQVRGWSNPTALQNETEVWGNAGVEKNMSECSRSSDLKIAYAVKTPVHNIATSTRQVSRERRKDFMFLFFLDDP